MNGDIVLVSGLIFVAFGITGTLAAWADSQRPIRGLVFLVIGIGLMAQAWTLIPGGYGPADIPDAIFRVIGLILRS